MFFEFDPLFEFSYALVGFLPLASVAFGLQPRKEIGAKKD